MSVPFVFNEFSVNQYMFCHPENVKLRRGRRQLMKWQHLVDTSELKLIFKTAVETKTLISVALTTNVRSLETLAPLRKLINRGLEVRVSDAWISFKWTTSKGNTQFQIAVNNSVIANQIVGTLRSNGVPLVVGKTLPLPRSLASLEPVFKVSGAIKQASSSFGPNYTQNSGSQFNNSRLVPPSTRFSQLETQIEIEEPMFVPNEAWEPTQVEDDSGLPMLSSETSSETSLAPNLETKLTNASPATLVPTNDSVLPQSRDISQTIARNETINVNIDVFAEARAPLSSTRRVTWRTAGLVSGLVLSLVSKNENGQCAIILSRGCDILHNFLFSVKNLRAFGADRLLVLSYSEQATQTRHLLQLDLPASDFELIKLWLEHWNIGLESPYAAVPHTESTALLSSMRPISMASTHFSERHFWANRFRPSSAASKASQRRNISRGSIHTNLGAKVREFWA